MVTAASKRSIIYDCLRSTWYTLAYTRVADDPGGLKLKIPCAALMKNIFI